MSSRGKSKVLNLYNHIIICWINLIQHYIQIYVTEFILMCNVVCLYLQNFKRFISKFLTK